MRGQGRSGSQHNMPMPRLCLPFTHVFPLCRDCHQGGAACTIRSSIGSTGRRSSSSGRGGSGGSRAQAAARRPGAGWWAGGKRSAASSAAAAAGRRGRRGSDRSHRGEMVWWLQLVASQVAGCLGELSPLLERAVRNTRPAACCPCQLGLRSSLPTAHLRCCPTARPPPQPNKQAPDEVLAARQRNQLLSCDLTEDEEAPRWRAEERQVHSLE